MSKNEALAVLGTYQNWDATQKDQNGVYDGRRNLIKKANETLLS